MSFFGSRDFLFEVQKGNIPGHAIMSAMGERTSIQTTAAGEDVWRGNELSNTPAALASHTTIPEPADAGEQMTFISESDADNGAAATGVLTLRMHYLDATGAEQTEDVTMNGQTGVDTTATDIRFINDLYSLTVGSGGVAAGNIRVYKKTGNTLVYNMIYVGGNKSLVPHRMVPLAKKLYLMGWHATEANSAGGKRAMIRLRSTDMFGSLLDGIFCFKDTTMLNTEGSGSIILPAVVIPALSIVKVSAWTDTTNAESSCSWWGYLVDD